MDFIAKNYREPLPRNTKFPVIVLHSDTWNDFGYVITFHVILYKSANESIDIGDIKILEKDNRFTQLPASFSKLESNQCSLGQSLEYYELLKRYLPNDFIAVLLVLNDIATNHDLAKEFESEAGYKDALFRFGSAEKAFDEAALLLFENRRKINETLAFTYTVRFNEATADHRVDFNFMKDDSLPFRINVLIGKNGTGKTRFLGSMVESISGVSSGENFEPYNPLFNKIIAISYSSFDDFPKPPQTTVFNYKYIGLRTEKEEVISDFQLGRKLREAFNSILANARTEFWFGIANKIIPLVHLGLNDVGDLNALWVKNISYEKAKRLSSGQSIILFILTELIANIQPQSLILFDEPETHLHPSAIAQLMNSFYDILDQFESCAIMSTHSPIIIQDVPAKYISVFERQGNLPIIRRLSLETFGENISELTSIAFGTIDVKELYKTYLENILKNDFGGITAVNEAFSNKLSFNAQLYLTAFEQNQSNEKP
jgi:predicted ATPase